MSHHPDLPHPHHITIHNGWLCWQDTARHHNPAPFTPLSTPIHLTADRTQNLLNVFATAYHITHAPAHTPN